jgi:1,2-diacylglycerol 3-alpha-glucosyltransferase
MRVLHIDFTGTFNEDMTYQESLIAKYNVKDGHEVTMLTTCYAWAPSGNMIHTGVEDKMTGDGYRLIRKEYKNLGHPFLTNRLRKVNGVYAVIEELNPEVIFVHCPQTLELLTVAQYAKRHPAIRLYIDNHTDLINSVPNMVSKVVLHKIIWGYCIRKILPYTRRFYGVTPLRCEFLHEMYGIPADRISLLLLGADDDRINVKDHEQVRMEIRALHGIESDTFLIVTGGKIDLKKNIHLLMKAVDAMANSRIRLLVFGNPDAELMHLFEKMSHSPYIQCIGWISADQTYNYLIAADLVVFPGSHSVLWEQAAGCGTPGIYKYWKGMDHVDIGGNCRFVYRDEVAEIIEVVSTIIDHPEEYRNMKETARQQGMKVFSYHEISRRAIES